MTAARLAEIRAWHDANQRVMGRTALRCAAGCEGCVICHVAELLAEVDRLAEWLDVAAAAENANAKDLRELRDLIALHGPVGAGNEADTLVEMKRLAFLNGLEEAAALCEQHGITHVAADIRDIVSKP